jgi:hypothetical protein
MDWRGAKRAAEVAYLEVLRRIERQYCQDHNHTPQIDGPLVTRG